MDITFKDVSFIYQQHTPFEHQALQNISFHIPSGSFTAIIGHTGSGKSTLIQHLNGLVTPSTGQVIIGNYVLNNEKKIKNMKELRSKVGVVFQYPEHQLFEETVAKDIAFGPTNFGINQMEIDNRIKEILPQVGLTEDILARSPLELSGGQMRRVAIAGVLVTKPEIYVLDEPTAGLDPRGQKEMMQMFQYIHQQTDSTMILVTHSMEDAITYADHIIILNQGEKYLEGNPLDIFKQEEKLTKVHLKLPEPMQFIKLFNQQFNANIKEDELSPQQLAQNIKQII